MIHVDTHLSYPKVVFGATCLLSIGVIFLVETAHVWSASGAPIVSGDVVARRDVRLWGGIPSGVMEIRLVDRPGVVRAELPRYEMKALPDRVRFHYLGDPGREVFIEGERHPVWGLILFWGLGIGLILVYVKSRGDRDD